MNHFISARLMAMCCALMSLSACTTTFIDEYKQSGMDSITLQEHESIVVLGRRHLSDYETEPKFVECIGDRLINQSLINVVSEETFINQLYPWFEPRTAPLKLRRMETLLSNPKVAEKISQMNVKYIIWVDGNTKITDSKGSISCSISPGGGGCFGFASWDKLASYEAVIWDVENMQEKGRVSIDAEGSSYLVAVVAPIPFIARVQANACKGLSNQLKNYFSKL